MNCLSNENIISLWSGLLFLIISAPFMYRLTNNIPGLKLSDAKGCPTMLGLLVHTLVFIIVVRLFMLIPIVNKEKYMTQGYQGLASPANMMRCNGAQLVCQDKDCDFCVKTASVCMKMPNSQECKDLLKVCLENCRDDTCVSMMNQNCKYI